MKLALNYYKPLTCELQHSIFLLNKKESNDFCKRFGPPSGIRREYRKSIPAPYKISGEGWIIKDGKFAKEIVYVIRSTYKEEMI